MNSLNARYRSLGLLSLFLFAFVLACSTSVNALTNVSACGTLGVAGEYYVLNQSVNSSVTCITVGANNVTLDCGYYGTQYNITGTGAASSYGVYFTGRTNVTVKNCLVLNWYYGVYAASSSHGATYANNNVSNNSRYGFFISSSSNNSFENNTAMYNGGSTYFAVYFSSSSYNNLTNNTASSNAGGFYFSYANYSSLVNSTASNNSQHGFVFEYSSNNSIEGNSALYNSYSYPYSGFYFSPSCSYNNFTNNTADNQYYGFFIQSSSYNSLVNNTANNSNHAGFYLRSSSSYNSLVNNTAANTAGKGFMAGYTSNNNSFINNTASNNSVTGLLFFESSRNNSLANNTVTKASGQGGFDFGGNNNDNAVYYSDFETTYLDTTNTVNGLPVKFYDGVRSPCPNNTVLSLGSTYSQIAFLGCNNVTLANTTAIGGISLFYTTNSTVTNSNASYGEYGLNLIWSDNNSFVNNSVVDNTYGIHYMLWSSNNSFSGNNVVTSKDSGFGIGLSNGSNYNVFSGDVVTTSGYSSHGFVFFFTNHGNVLRNLRVSTTGSFATAIRPYGGGPFDRRSINFTMFDSVFDVSHYYTTSFDAFYVTPDSSWNLTNCSFNKSSTNIRANGTLNVFWYVDVRVTDNNGVALSGAYVNASDVNGTSVFNASTNSSGWIPRQTVLEYYQNKSQDSSGIYNVTPHWFNASLAGYSPNASQTAVDSSLSVVRELFVRSVTNRSPSDGASSSSYAQSFCFVPTSINALVNASLLVGGVVVAGNSSELVNASSNCVEYVFSRSGSYSWRVLVYDSGGSVESPSYSLEITNAFVGGGGGTSTTSTPTVVPSLTATPSVEPTLTPSLAPTVVVTPSAEPRVVVSADASFPGEQGVSRSAAGEAVSKAREVGAGGSANAASLDWSLVALIAGLVVLAGAGYWFYRKRSNA